MPHLSIVIAHRGDPLGLWATIQSCEIDLAGTGFDYEFNIVSNGETESVDLKRVIQFVKKSGHLGTYQHFEEGLTPPVARQRATKDAQGRILAFFDNHCLVAKDYFRRLIADFDHLGADMIHSATKFYEGEFVHYHYRLLLNQNFWAESSLVPQHSLKPYRIAMAGHGGFAVLRSVWEEVGGYGPEGLFSGYAGEESYFDLKMALLDKTNWIDPKVVHYHYAGRRAYPRHYTDDYYRNLMTCAYVIGGNKWLDKVFEHFVTSSCKHKTGKTMYELMTDAFERGKEHAVELVSIRKRTLDEQLKLFAEQQIAWD